MAKFIELTIDFKYKISINKSQIIAVVEFPDGIVICMSNKKEFLVSETYEGVIKLLNAVVEN